MKHGGVSTYSIVHYRSDIIFPFMVPYLIIYMSVYISTSCTSHTHTVSHHADYAVSCYIVPVLGRTHMYYIIAHYLSKLLQQTYH